MNVIIWLRRTSNYNLHVARISKQSGYNCNKNAVQKNRLGIIPMQEFSVQIFSN